jgi:hypothetical protein
MGKTLSTTQLVELVERLQRADFESEEEDDAALALFESSVPHPQAADLIYYPAQHFGEGHEPTAEEVVERALSYKPIELGPAT